MKPKLKDIAKVKFIAGRGGDGAMHFGPMKVPMGGNGGNGGNVYIEGVTNLYDLSYINNDMVVKAEQGERGGKKNLTGRNGKDLIFKVPLITKIFDEEGNLIMTIDKAGEPQKLISGGLGGLGNHHFRAGQLHTLEKTTNGKDGQEVTVKLELNLKADVIFIGLPNAGKSSIINELTNAESKIGAYAFTTIEPVLGNMDGIVLMDLPGLIEGTFGGKGLGIKFKKHAETSKLIAHFISLESDDVLRDYKLIRTEVENISERLSDLPEVIVLNKSDLISKEDLQTQVKKLESLGKEIIIVSAYDFDSLQNLIKRFKDLS